MKIALLTDGISPYVVGGMQTHSAIIAKHLVANGNDVDLFHFVNSEFNTPSDKEVNSVFAFDSNLKFGNIYCCSFPKSSRFPGHYLFNSYRYSKWIFEILKKQIDDYDFIYAKGFSSWCLLKSLKKYNKSFKIGINFHGYEMFQYAPTLKVKMQHLMLRPFVKKINKKADIVFSYGGKISSIIEKIGVPKPKIFEIPALIDNSWININKSKILKSNKLKFLFAGRNERRKGIRELYQAIEIVDDYKIESEFHFMGNISREKKLNIKFGKLVFHGEVNDENLKKKIYDSCDVLICPSYSEGMPNVILEAMSRGLAVIATDVGAVCEMVSDKNGILIDDNHPEKIANSINTIIKNKSILNKLKQNSITKVKERFSSEIVFEKLVNTIKIIDNW